MARCLASQGRLDLAQDRGVSFVCLEVQVGVAGELAGARDLAALDRPEHAGAGVADRGDALPRVRGLGGDRHARQALRRAVDGQEREVEDLVDLQDLRGEAALVGLEGLQLLGEAREEHARGLAEAVELAVLDHVLVGQDDDAIRRRVDGRVRQLDQGP